MNTTHHIPYPFYWDDVPIDLSFIYQDEKPAGKHGFLQVKEGEFVFEDGTAPKFWGTNLNSGSNFPPHDFSEKLAKRLAKIGVNLIRFHQLDAEWSTPNIFQFAKGKRKGNTLSFDPESMDRLDYLIFCLKQEGIYMYMDMLTYRKFTVDDGVEQAPLLQDAARPYSNFDETLIRLQKKFNDDLWTHRNPYTGLAYKDDPAIVLTEVANESDMFSRTVIIPSYKANLELKFRDWLELNHIDYEHKEQEINFSSDDKIMLDFLSKIQEDYYVEMIGHLRSIGVKIPIAGTNWASNAGNRRAQLVTDFTDGHAYWYSWQWSEKLRKFNNHSMVAKTDTILSDLTFCRLLDRPYFISEWDDPWPNEWRAESPLFMAAIGSLQGWSGFAIHTYAYTTRTDIDRTGKEISSSAIGNVPFREGVFTTWNDPSKFGLFYHAALMFRRGDIKQAEKSVGIRINDLSLRSTIDSTPALSLISEKHRVGMEFTGQNNKADQYIEWNDENAVDKSSGEILSDTGELYRNWHKRFGWIDTDKSKVIYGFLGEIGEITIKGLKVHAQTDFATIALSSLTEKPIVETDNMLLTMIGRSENTEMKFNADHTELLDVGRAPILVEVIEAEIKMNTNIPNLRVWSVNPEGFFAGVVPSEYENGVLSFKTGAKFPSMYYLIQAE